ncbi:MAG: BON domain-containing protein [Desulfobacteraceae bacterium]
MTINDHTIKTDILKRIRRDTRINDAMIDVSVSMGHAVLSGVVSSYRKKLAVQLKVKQTRGVISVDNRLEVFYSQEVSNPPDQQIKKTVETILKAHPDIDHTKVEIEITAGKVTLTGSVKGFWQLHTIEELVANVIGVIDLKNELTVVPTEEVNDEAIAQDIMEELKGSTLIDQSQILVEVANGTVILSGTVNNYGAEKEAYEAAMQQNGVKRVTNNISVAF